MFKVLIPDNMKAIVVKADTINPQFNVGWLEVASSYRQVGEQVSGRASPTVDQAEPGRPMDAPAYEITSPALSSKDASPINRL
ncbi:MAG TPA: hypothetical protein VE197_09325 [Mycobacterium sp.]|nr:hypothetical protein [Mycobacterium sp.]